MVDSEFQLPVSADHDTTRQHWAELAGRDKKANGRKEIPTQPPVKDATCS
jgi:hypothetical protein